MFKEGDIIQCIKLKSDNSKIDEIDKEHLGKFFEVRNINDELKIPRANSSWKSINESYNDYKVWNINHSNFKGMYKLICNINDLKFLTLDELKEQEIICIKPDNIWRRGFIIRQFKKYKSNEYDSGNGIQFTNKCLENSFILKSDWDKLVANSKEDIEWNYVDLTTLKMGDEFVLVKEIDLNEQCPIKGKLYDDKFILYSTYKIIDDDQETFYFKSSKNCKRDVRRSQFKNKFVTLEEYNRVMKLKGNKLPEEKPVVQKEIIVINYKDFKIPLNNIYNKELFYKLLEDV